MARETLVFLPGMMCDARLFGPQIGVFENEYHVIVSALDSASTISEIANAVLQTLPEGPFNVVGLSMGGIVAMELARLAPVRLKRLALLDTNHLADTPDRVAMRNTQIDKINSGHLHTVVVDEMKPSYLAQKNRSNKDLLALLIDMAMELGADVFVRQSLALRDREDQSETLQRIKVPTLVLCGEEDTLCPYSRHETISSLVAGSELVAIPEAGHITTLENPPAVNKALTAWLKRPIV